MKDTELQDLAKRLYVARAEQRVIDTGTYGANSYGPVSLEDCYIELKQNLAAASPSKEANLDKGESK